MTTTATQPKPVNDDYLELKAPELWKWERKGDRLQGVLMSIEPTRVKGKNAIEYLIAGENGASVKMLATYDILQKLTPQWIGHRVLIEYLGEDESIQTQGNPMKIFRVKVSRAKYQNNTQVNDSDIGF